MTKKKPAKRIASNGPRLPGQPTKKTVKARARARKGKELSAEDVRAALDEPSPLAQLTEDIERHYQDGYMPVLDDVGLVGQQAVKTEFNAGLDASVYDVIAESFIQPVDVPIQVMPAFDVPAVTRRELRLNTPNLSPKQQRAKRRLEDGTGWRCLGCYRVLHPKLNSCPYCSKRKLRA